MQEQDTRMSWFSRFIFGFVALNALIGAASLIIFPTQTNALFFWEIRPPINAGLFGALYLGGAVTVAWVTYRGSWEQARFLIPILVAAGFFISLTTLLHIERFTPGIKLVYWLIIYIGAPLLALGLYIYYERRGANWAVSEPILPLVRDTAIVTGIIVLALGTILMIWPDVALEFWPWNVSPLMIRIFAAWFNAFGIGLLWFYFDRDWGRLHLIPYLMIAAAGLDLVMIFVHRDDWRPVGISIWVYCFHLVAFGLVGLLIWWWQRRASRINQISTSKAG
jgi:hypothetical protein